MGKKIDQAYMQKVPIVRSYKQRFPTVNLIAFIDLASIFESWTQNIEVRTSSTKGLPY